MKHWLEQIRQSGNISRFHTRGLLFPQSISQHSFQSVFIALELAKNVEGIDEHKIVMYSLLHDIPESSTGDVQGNVKKRYPELKKMLDNIEGEWVQKNVPNYLKGYYNINHKEKEICKFSDIIDCLVTSLIEVRLGNSSLDEAVEDTYNDCVTRWIGCDDGNLLKNVDEVLAWIETEFENELDKVLEDNHA